MVILDSSPMPSSSVNTGSRASVAVLRNSSSSGFRNEFSQPYQAIRSPRTTADTTAMPKPDTERVTLACRWLCSWPFSTSRAPAASTSCRGGRNTRVAGLARYSGPTSHSARNRTTASEFQPARPVWRAAALSLAAAVGRCPRSGPDGPDCGIADCGIPDCSEGSTAAAASCGRANTVLIRRHSFRGAVHRGRCRPAGFSGGRSSGPGGLRRAAGTKPGAGVPQTPDASGCPRRRRGRGW